MVTVDNLLKTPQLKELKVAAGHDGLHRQVKSVSVMDAPDSYKWLKGGEFILSSGFLFGGDAWQVEHFVENLIEAGSSAFGIKTKRFLDKLPEAVIKTANKHNFTIIEIPYHFGWSEIIRTFYELSKAAPAAYEYTESENTSSAADNREGIYQKFITEITSRTITPEKIRRFEQFRKPDKPVYTGMLLIKSADLTETCRSISGLLNSGRLSNKARTEKHIVENIPLNEAAVMLEVYPKQGVSAEEWQFMFYEEAETHICGAENVVVSMGKLYSELSGIAASFEQAETAYEIGRKLWKDKNCYFYPLVSVYDIQRRADPAGIDLSYINMLDGGKAKFEFDGIETLEAYIECGGYKKAAQKLFLHENTLRYRIQKIGDFLRLNMDDPVVCGLLLMQIKIWRLSGKS